MIKIKQKKGSILAFAVILMSFMMVIAIALAFSSLRGRKSVNVSSNSTTAFQKTDEGMEKFLFELFENSKPFDYLSDLAKSLDTGDGKSYKCEVINEGGQSTAVIIGNDFKMISYKEINPEKNDGNEFEIVKSCKTEIIRISKVKVSGNYNNATRSIEFTLSNSLDRDRIARWDFEDNVQSVRDYDSPGAPEAKDSSKEGDYILTLCPIESEGPNKLVRTKETKNCPLMSINDGNELNGFYMNHIPKWYKYNKPDEDGKCFFEEEGEKKQISCGSYVAGVYFDGSNGKGKGSGGFMPIKYNTEPESEDYYKEEERTGSEALEFNGVSHFLAPNLTTSGSDALNYVKPESQKILNFDGKDGFSISFWVNNNSKTGDTKEVLISKSTGDKDGYEIYLEDDKIYFRVNGQKVSANLGKDSWHHVVVRYDSGSKGGHSGILVDGGMEKSSDLTGAGNVKDDEKTPLFVGGVYKGDDEKKFEPDEFESAFGGMLDQIEIFNRYLIDFEVEKLCNIGAGEDWISEPTGTVSDVCKDIVW